ncbi:TerD family protein [Jatrophihabitans sp. YIM 134969]
MPIDYTKRPTSGGSGQPPPPGQPPAGGGAPVSLSKVTLTKAQPTVSLAKHGGVGGTLRVSLNWNAKPPSGLFKHSNPIDLDLACLYEFSDGSKGAVQALGNMLQAPAQVPNPIVRLSGDDRSGGGGEEMFVDLNQAASIKRIIVFAFIYEGAANWAEAGGVARLYPANGPEIEVALDEPRNGARTCAIALLTNTGGDIDVRREVRYIDGMQQALDEAYGWGMRWQAARK